jgi:hypothetical protein
VFIYAGLFGVGKLVLGWWAAGMVCVAVATVAGYVIVRSLGVRSEE